ncbi:hypothetical protein ZWY2020_050343 [Hordeum vulgare]|nr:hypothetical protein ZWY2020_050343 [Hordeum vulgare]
MVSRWLHSPDWRASANPARCSVEWRLPRRERMVIRRHKEMKVAAIGHGGRLPPSSGMRSAERQAPAPFFNARLGCPLYTSVAFKNKGDAPCGTHHFPKADTDIRPCQNQFYYLHVDYSIKRSINKTLTSQVSSTLLLQSYKSRF